LISFCVLRVPSIETCDFTNIYRLLDCVRYLYEMPTMAYSPFCALEHPANGGIKLYEANRADVTQLYLPLCNKSVYNEEMEIGAVLLGDIHCQM
ncbi:hypothetical protein ACVPRA_23715, partial [Salmonella enterica subsp. enterica serovar Enteritidis]